MTHSWRTRRNSAISALKIKDVCDALADLASWTTIGFVMLALVFYYTSAFAYLSFLTVGAGVIYMVMKVGAWFCTRKIESLGWTEVSLEGSLV